MTPVIFLAGPYTAKSMSDIEANVTNAARWGGVVKRLGWVPMCPHTNSHRIALESMRDFGLCHKSFYTDALALLERCDAILMIEGYEQSEGAKAAHAFAEEHDIPVFLWRHWDSTHDGIPKAKHWQDWLFEWQRKRNAPPVCEPLHASEEQEEPCETTD